ncbi:ATP synthase subunit I [Paenibacillus brevis]|uniref:ATP synthase subunit I n=1 Tax=Paenibacillus brevis TaxID=2841508 RepID=A0ABS6FN34_9BACL|nr:ATP synthase subunit I [Paenibacillus brevis]MBU5670907.1 ATP synthase subunit I [Paenibacillus brevis]
MDELSSIVTAVTRVTLLILSAMLIGWAFLPMYRLIFGGLILGLTFGLVYVRFLSAKVRGLVNLVVSEQQKRYSFGFLTRVCLVLVAVMFAVRFEHFSIVSTIIGLFTPLILTLPAGIVIGLRNKS